MLDITDQEEILRQMAQRLRTARLQRNESQEIFAARIGISRQTYIKMEGGVATIPIGHWLTASSLLDRLESWRGVLAETDNLFERYEQQQVRRKRASRKQKRKP